MNDREILLKRLRNDQAKGLTALTLDIQLLINILEDSTPAASQETRQRTIYVDLDGGKF